MDDFTVLLLEPFLRKGRALDCRFWSNSAFNSANALISAKALLKPKDTARKIEPWVISIIWAIFS